MCSNDGAFGHGDIFEHAELLARTMTVTVRFGDFQTSNRSPSVKDGISVDDNGLSRRKEIASMLILPFFDAAENPQAKAFLLIRLPVEEFSETAAGALWEGYAPS